MVGLGMAANTRIPSVEQVQVVALYDSSGAIKHLHMVTTLSGATPPTQEEAVAEAKTRARRHNPNVDDLAIALSNDIEHGRRPHRIDTNTNTFVLLPGEK